MATCTLVLQCSRGQAVPLPTFERVAEDVRVGDVVGVVGFPAKTKIGVLSIIPHAVPPLSAHASPMPGFSHTHGCCGLIAPASLGRPRAWSRSYALFTVPIPTTTVAIMTISVPMTMCRRRYRC